MFKLIEFIRYDEDTYSYIYKLVDTDFECEVAAAFGVGGEVTVATIQEYKKRNYSSYQISKNLFKCNLHLSDKYKHSFEEILDQQNKDLDKYFKDINFSKLYYQDLKDMWDKHKAFM